MKNKKIYIKYEKILQIYLDIIDSFNLIKIQYIILIVSKPHTAMNTKKFLI